jgi:hypothetical protein
MFRKLIVPKKEDIRLGIAISLALPAAITMLQDWHFAFDSFQQTANVFLMG